MLRRFSLKSLPPPPPPPPPPPNLNIPSSSSSIPLNELKRRFEPQISLNLEETEMEVKTLHQLLDPSPEAVQQAIFQAKPCTRTRLIFAFFDLTEEVFYLCLLLRDHISNAHSLYTLLNPVLSDDFFLHPQQIHAAFDIFLQFHHYPNPLPDNASHFLQLQNIRLRLVQLMRQFDLDAYKPPRRPLLYQIAALCLITLFTAPFHFFIPCNFFRNQIDRIRRLDAKDTGKYVYVLDRDLDSIHRLMTRLHLAVEADKLLVGFGLERGRDDVDAIQEVMKQLRKNYSNFHNQLEELEEHVCLVLVTINRARLLVLQEIPR